MQFKNLAISLLVCTLLAVFAGCSEPPPKDYHTVKIILSGKWSVIQDERGRRYRVIDWHSVGRVGDTFVTDLTTKKEI